jgi:hypothetical protein
MHGLEDSLERQHWDLGRWLRAWGSQLFLSSIAWRNNNGARTFNSHDRWELEGLPVATSLMGVYLSCLYRASTSPDRLFCQCIPTNHGFKSRSISEWEKDPDNMVHTIAVQWNMSTHKTTGRLIPPAACDDGIFDHIPDVGCCLHGLTRLGAFGLATLKRGSGLGCGIRPR